ncbi:MAG TPA: sigma-70 family RNA polymerase sigma factor [Gemmataceae bacterium]|nr:sigma-70 family RNA polymerase sigma factor [Gemmataceae bacterium]
MIPTRTGHILEHLRNLVVKDEDGTSDRELLHRFARRRDEAAFATLVRRHGPMVLQVCRRTLHNWHDAEEVCQGVFLVLASKAASRHWQKSIANWLHQVAYHLALNARTAAIRRALHESRAPTPHSQDPVAEITGRELRAVLDEELARLPYKYRAPLVLCYLEGATRDEAARQLDWPLSTLKSRVERGRELLGKRLAARGLTLSAGLSTALLLESPSQAALPAGLAMSIAHRAIAFAGSRMTAGAVASERSAQLAQAMLKSMRLNQFKAVAMWLLGGCLLVAGAGVGAHSLSPIQQPEANLQDRSHPVALAGEKLEAAETQIRTDRYGDPLPDGALARLGTIRFRYAGWLYGLAFSPDGIRLVSVGSDGVRQWEVESGRPLGVFGENADALAFLDGGKRILTGGESVVIWATADGREVRRLPIKGGLHHCSVSPDGTLLAGAASDGALLLIDAVTGAVLKQLNGHEDQLSKLPQGAQPRIGQIQSVAFSPDGKSLASACFQDSRVFIWDPATGKVRHTLPGHNQPNVVLFSPNGRMLAVGGNDCLIHVWDVATGRKLQQLRGHLGPIQGLAFSPDGLSLASGASGNPPGMKGGVATDSTLRLWDLQTGKSRPLPGPERSAQSVTFSPDGKSLAAGGSGTSIHLIDLATGKRKQERSGHEGRIFRVALSPDGSTLASGGEDNVIYLWDLKTNQEKARLEGHQGHVSGLAFTPDGAELVSCSYDGTVRVWDWRRGKEIRRLAETNGWHYGLDLAPDGKTLVLPTGQLWNVTTGKQIGVVPNYRGLMPRAMFSPGGKTLAVPGRRCAVLEIATGKEICCFTGHEAKQGDPRINGVIVDCVAFSPDGRRAASGGAEGMAYIWDAASGQMLRRLQGHENPIIDITFSLDGRTVATADGSLWNHKEQTVRLWEALTGKERRRFVGHQAQVTSIVFSHDAQRIISGSEDGTALVWDATGVLKPQTAKATNENLWHDLAGEDGVAAYEAMCALTARQEVAFLARLLRPVKSPDPAIIGRLLADLDNSDFATRRRAERALDELEQLAESGLRKAMVESTSLEVRRRADTLLTKLDTSPPSSKTIQALRAVEVLERIATPEALDVLKTLAGGAPEARLTQEALASLQRLSRRHCSASSATPKPTACSSLDFGFGARTQNPWKHVNSYT